MSENEVFYHSGAKQQGTQYGGGKLDWSVIPLEILEPLVKVFMAGEKKYGCLNCLKEFQDGDRRFFADGMRHKVESQFNPLAIDEETGCYHSAQDAWNTRRAANG